MILFKKYLSALVCLLVVTFANTKARAQLDPMSTLLINSGSSNSGEEESLDSSRYTVKPTRPPANKPKPVLRVKPSKNKPVPSLSNEQESIESLVEPKTQGAQGKDGSTQEKGIGEQVKDLVMGGSEDDIGKYRDYVHPEDPRRNLLEISFSPLYLYNNSSSNYWYRSYFASSPGFMVGASFWVSPFMGIQASYMTSLGADLRGNPTGTKRIAANHQIYDAGLRFRNFFGFSKKAPAVTFGVDFQDSQLRVPTDATNRISLKTSGVGLSLEATVVNESGNDWIFGFGLTPKADHEELESTIAVNSGSAVETEVIRLWIGQRFNFSRHSRMFWRITHMVEKSFFEGQANLVDPVSSETIEGVSVTNGLTTFGLGYTWGD